jgi:ubiquinone biosynthesis protein COQ9
MIKDIYTLKKEVLFSTFEILPYEAFDGNIISKACANIDLQPEHASLLFPNGRMELLEMFRDHIDKVMIERIKKELVDVNSITARIYEAIKIRLELLVQYKIAISKIASFFAIPWNNPKLYPYTWHSMHLIWKTAGKDVSKDFNYYTKRGLLTGVYWFTMLYWLSDESEGYHDTYAFLTRELKFVGKMGAKISKLGSVASTN